MNRERLFAALLFAVAAMLFWLGFVAVFRWAQGVFVVGGAASSVTAAALVAARLAPRLISDARSSTSAWRGGLAGVVVTLLSYVTGALLFALGAAFWDVVTGGPDRLVMAFQSVLAVFVVGLVYAVTLFSPALAFGGAAGMVYYHLARLGNQPAT